MIRIRKFKFNCQYTERNGLIKTGLEEFMTHWEIKTFIKIVKYRSISKAAKKLYLTQSTVSHRINVLEEELGVKLIIRRKGYRSIESTHDGEAFSPWR